MTILLAFYALLLLLWVVVVLLLRAGLAKAPERRSDQKPFCSVIIAARNEETHIGRLLEALAKQDYQGDYEVLIVDDNSTDRTSAIIDEYALSNGKVRLLSAPVPEPGVSPKKSALNFAISRSIGELLLFTDADCVPGSGWITGMVGQFGEGVVAVAGFSPLTGEPAAFDSFVNAVISAGSAELGDIVTAVGRNLGYRKKAFEAIGGFGETLYGASGDDDLLVQRLSNIGRVIFSYDRETIVTAEGPGSFAGWISMKRRHLSAGKRYPVHLIVIFSGAWLFHLYLASIPVFLFYSRPYAAILAGGWLLKAIADFTTLFYGALRLGYRGWILPWLVAEIISPFIVVVLAPLSLVGKVVWKGRSLNR